MQSILPKTVSPQQIAACLGISQRAVRQQAGKGCWPKIHKKGRGGASAVFMVSGLPEHVRRALAVKYATLPAGPAAQAGYAGAKEIARQTVAATRARQNAKEQGLAAYQHLPQARKIQADARYAILCARDAFIAAAGLSQKKGTSLFIREYRAGAIQMEEWVQQAVNVRLSWVTLYRWEKAYQDGGMAGLAACYEGTRQSGIAGHMQDFIKGLLCAKPHLGIPTVRQAVAARFAGQTIPSDSAIRRFVTGWKQENQALIQYITSPDQWRSRHLIALGKADEEITRLNQVWEFDSTPGDVMLSDGRQIGVIDVYSRRAKVQTPTSRAAAIAAVTRRAIIDWGVPEVAKTDNGSDYVSAHMIRVFEDLAIWQEICRPFHPEEKPFIERFFWTLLHSIFELLPGYIGHSVAERKQIESRRSFAKRLMSQGQDPVQIDLTCRQLQTICDRWCQAVYHHNVHGGLSGKTPYQVANAWTEKIRRLGDIRALDVLLSPAPDKDGTRVITKHGIQVQNGTYIAAALGPHVGKTVFVLLDATDYGTIHVFLIKPDGAKEFLCQAVDPGRTWANRADIAAAGRRY